MESCREMKNDQFSLKWDDFTCNIINSLELSLDNQDFVDVTLVCKEGSVKAHRLVLSACSTFFQRVLKENLCAHPVIVLKGIALTELEILLMFMYHGEARIHEQNVPRLLEAAQFLEIRGLASHQYNQAPAESTASTVIDTDITNDFIRPGVHTTVQAINDPLSCVTQQMSPANGSNCQQNNGNVNQKNASENVELLIIKQEPDEERTDFQEFPAKIVPIQTLPITERRPEEEENSRFPELDFSVHENGLVARQKSKQAGLTSEDLNPNVSPVKGKRKRKAEVLSTDDSDNSIDVCSIDVRQRPKSTCKKGFEQIIKNQNIIKGLLRNLSEKTSQLSTSVEKIATTPIFSARELSLEEEDTLGAASLLPVENFKALEELEELLGDKMFENKLIKCLGRMGGENAAVACRRCLRSVLTDNVACQFSWAGQKGKKVFSKLNLKAVIFKAVQMQFMSATDKEIESCIKDWLRPAKNRLMLREKSRKEIGEKTFLALRQGEDDI